MSPDTVIPIDRAHYDAIIATAEAIKHVSKTVDSLVIKVDAIEEKLGECPCEAVKRLDERITPLEAEANVSKGRFGMLDLLLTAGASAGGGGGISMLILKLLGGGGSG